MEIPDKGYSRHFKYLKELDHFLPPLAEQKAITQKLDTLLAQVDNIKQRLDSIPAILKNFRQSVLAAAVSGKLTEAWRGENGDSLLSDNKYKGLLFELNQQRSDSEKKRIIKAKSADWFYDRSESIPEGWIQASLIEITKLITCGVAKKPDYTEEGVPFLSAQNSKPFSPNLNKIKYIKEDDFKTFTVGGKPEKNDVLYSRVGANFGEACVIPWDFDFAIYVSLTLIKPVHEILNSQYLTLFLNSIDGVLQSRGGILGSGIQNLNVESVRKYRIPLPSIEEQTEIVRRVEELFAFADQIEQQVKNAQSRVNNLTQSILAKAFRGELTEQWRIDNPELISGENSAEVLLKKIQQEREKLKPAKKTRAKKTLVNKKDTPVTADATDVAAIQGKPTAVATLLPEDDIEWALTIREACSKNTSLLAQDELSRLIADHLGLKRLTEQRKEAIKKAVTKACKTHLLYKEDGQYCLYQPRFADYENDSLDLVIQKAARKGSWIEQEALYRACLNYLGFKRSSDLAMERFKSYVNSALRRKILERDGSLLKRV